MNPTNAVDYRAASIAVRADLATAHAQVLEHLASPGTWWTGSERRAIAEAARAARGCALCAERKAALSPFSVAGDHEGPSDLEPEVVDVVHRIVTDPGRLTKSWYEGVTSSATLDPESYIELIGVTVFLTAVDAFARAVGVEPRPLPDAAPGEPSRRRPPGAALDRAWVPRLVGGADGQPAWHDLWGDRADVAEVERGLSLVPSEVDFLNRFAPVHYMDFRHVPDPRYAHPDRALDRLQNELVASRVSLVNECFY